MLTRDEWQRCLDAIDTRHHRFSDAWLNAAYRALGVYEAYCHTPGNKGVRALRIEAGERVEQAWMDAMECEVLRRELIDMAYPGAVSR